MSDFLKRGSSLSPSDVAAQKEAVMSSIRSELAQANAQLLINNMNERCFKACVTKPGASLSSSEETCLARCLDRFMEAFDMTSRTYVARLGRERALNAEDPLRSS